MRAAFKGLSFWLGVILGALTVANLMHQGLAVTLSGFPQRMYAWYKLIFHGSFDLIFGLFRFNPPILVKDLYSAYIVLGYIVMRALVITGGITFIDHESETDFRMATLEHLYHETIGRIPFVRRPARSAYLIIVTSIMTFLAWPACVFLLRRWWTRDGYAAMAYSNRLFSELPLEHDIVPKRLYRGIEADRKSGRC